MPTIQTHQRMLKSYQLWCSREDENVCESQPSTHSFLGPCMLYSEMEAAGFTDSFDFAFPQLWFSGKPQVPCVEPYHTILFLWLNPAWNSQFKVPTECELPHYNSLYCMPSSIMTLWCCFLVSPVTFQQIQWPLSLPHYSDLSVAFDLKPLSWHSLSSYFEKGALCFSSSFMSSHCFLQWVSFLVLVRLYSITA